MSTDTHAVGIREIDPGALPTRYARGWHCLGVANDFQDGKPHAIHAFGAKLVVFADSHGDLKVLDGILTSKQGIEALRDGFPLGIAKDISLGDEKLFRQAAQQAKQEQGE